MGRTNLIILCFGFIACIALSLMMKQVVVVKDKTGVDAAVAGLHTVFNEQLRDRPKLAIDVRDGRKVATLTVTASEVVGPNNVPRLARNVGRYLSQCRDQELRFEALIVIAKSTTGGADRRFDIPVMSTGGLRTGWQSGTNNTEPPKPNARRKPSMQVKPGAKPAPKTKR